MLQIKRMFPRHKDIFSDGDDIHTLSHGQKAEVVVLGWRINGISGESYDRSELNLPGDQEAVGSGRVTGVPIVLVLQNGRPLTIAWAAEHVPAILEAWYPGDFGGRAIAETISGKTIPPVAYRPLSAHVGQLPVYYNHFPSKNIWLY